MAQCEQARVILSAVEFARANGTESKNLLHSPCSGTPQKRLKRFFGSAKPSLRMTGRVFSN